MTKTIQSLMLLVFMLLTSIRSAKAQTTPHFDVLVFSKTAGFTHGSIPEAITALQQMASTQGFTAVFTEDAADFTAANLAGYEAVVFLMTSGDVLNAAQQTAFEAYIQKGGGDCYDYEDPFVINNDASSGIQPGVFANWHQFLYQ